MHFFNTLIQKIDEIRELKGRAIVFMSTNRLHFIDEAILRRAAIVLEFKRPTKQECIEVYEKSLLGLTFTKEQLDELAELINVLRGHMSLVGPRPDVTGYADKLVGEDRNILELRPGITGPASLKYSNEEEILAKQKNPKAYNDEVIYPDKVRINLEYYNNQSIWLDIKIIFATIFRTSY